MVYPMTHSQFNAPSLDPTRLDDPTIHPGDTIELQETAQESNPTQSNDPEVLKLQIQLAQIQLQLATVRQNTPQTHPAEPVAPHSPENDCFFLFTPNNDYKDKKSPQIQPFHREASNFDCFLVKINGAFLLVPWKFANNIQYVVFTCQYLEGNPTSWAKPILTKENLELQSDWTKFFTTFCEQFQDPNIHDYLTE